MDRPGTVIEVTLDDDVVSAVERLQDELGIDVDEALNLLARRGMAAERITGPSAASPVVHQVLSVDAADPLVRPPG